MTLPCKHSDYIVFVDESGDHGLKSIDDGYPLFVLAFCILRKEDYIRQLTPAFQSVKLKHFGHDNIILHERDIRKDTGYFSSLKNILLKNKRPRCIHRDPLPTGNPQSKNYKLLFGGANPIEPTCDTEHGQSSEFGTTLSTYYRTRVPNKQHSCLIRGTI